MQNEQKKSQIDRLLEKLRSLEPDVSPNDRKEAAKILGTSTTVISRYLNSDKRAGSIDKALALFLFFKKRIEEREVFLI